MDNGSKIAGIALIGLLLISSVCVFMMMEAYRDANPDPYEETRRYTVEGTLDGSDCTGVGRCEFLEEGGGGRVYRITLDFKDSASGHKGGAEVHVIFGSDDRMAEMFEYEGTATIDGKETSVYTFTYEGVDYKFYVMEKCEILRITAVSDSFSVVADEIVSA